MPHGSVQPSPHEIAFSVNVWRLRMEKGLTHAQLAACAGVPASTVQRVEQGRHRINLGQAAAIARWDATSIGCSNIPLTEREDPTYYKNIEETRTSIPLKFLSTPDWNHDVRVRWSDGSEDFIADEDITLEPKFEVEA